MTILNRREFLKILGASSLAASAPGYLLGKSVQVPARHAILNESLAELALETAKKAGADYADVRLCSYAWQWLDMVDGKINEMEDFRDSGFSIRVIANGAWGFAANYDSSESRIKQVAIRAVELAKQASLVQHEKVKLTPLDSHIATYKTPYKEDPIEVPMQEKMQLLFSICDGLKKVKGISRTEATMYAAREDKHYYSSIGSSIKQRIVHTECEYTATASAKDDFQTRKYTLPARTAGYEYVRDSNLLQNIERVGLEAVEKVNANICPANMHRDLLLLPSHLWLTIHESVGHPTELDRALGWEANYAGTSFVTPDKLDTLQDGSKLVNLRADRTRPGGLSTCAYDDEGVKTGEWYIVKNGKFIDYQTNRETAALISAKKSNGCAYADSWLHVPIIRIPNLCLDPDPQGPKLDELIADTKDGILIDGDGSYSIDQQRRNFQFGGDAFWEIKNGKKIRMLKSVTYQADTTEFWNSVDAICSPDSFDLFGTLHCGKGQPGQSGKMSHGASPTRFKNILTGVS